MAGTIESEPFTIFIHDNDRLDPIGRFVQISAGPDQSSGYFGTSADLTVTDHEYLTISLASGGDTIPEDFEADVKIERSNVDEASGNNLTVSLTLDRTDAGTLSSDSIDLANDTSGFVQFAPANDNQWTGRRSVVITASVAGFFGDQFTLFIDEDEQLDFGDAPDLPPDVDGDGVPNETDPCPTDSDLNAECDVLFYPTLAINDGARHVIQSNGPRLGNKTDAEPDGQPSADATGDDTNSPTGSGDDEDGAWFVNPGDDVPVSEFVLGASYELVLDTQFDTAGSGEQPEAFVDYWIDWNGNGVWDESEHVREQVGTYDPAADNGSPARFFITVPSDAAAGDTYARFRVSTAGIETPTGLPPDGEVEDYAINVIVPEVSIDDAQVVEGDDGLKSLVFTVTRSTDRGEFSVNYQTANVTATAGADYTATSGTLPFADVGVLGQPISIPILGDQIDEDNETFTVTLTTTDGITLARDTATGTITDDDTAGITITPTSTPALVTTEAGGTATFTVQLDSQPTGEVTIAADQQRFERSDGLAQQPVVHFAELGHAANCDGHRSGR